jgi:hypothetical protein
LRLPIGQAHGHVYVVLIFGKVKEVILQ